MTIGFLALAGVAAKTAVIMLVYTDHTWADRAAAGQPLGIGDVYAAAMDRGVERVRPRMMTVASTMFGLLPILWDSGTGASVMNALPRP